MKTLALRHEPRVVTGGDDAAGRERLAQLRPPRRRERPAVVQAARDPGRLAIAEVNPRMPRVPGFDELGGNRITSPRSMPGR